MPSPMALVWWSAGVLGVCELLDEEGALMLCAKVLVWKVWTQPCSACWAAKAQLTVGAACAHPSLPSAVPQELPALFGLVATLVQALAPACSAGGASCLGAMQEPHSSA